jgi:hypothetical protein
MIPTFAGLDRCRLARECTKLLAGEEQRLADSNALTTESAEHTEGRLPEPEFRRPAHILGGIGPQPPSFFPSMLTSTLNNEASIPNSGRPIGERVLEVGQLKTAKSDGRMKGHGHQDRAYGNSARPTRRPSERLDESPPP